LIDVNVRVEERAQAKPCAPSMVGEATHFVKVGVLVQHQTIINGKRDVLA